ncbi:MAG: IPT/TIG domain-containing protein [Candidatus Sericytochromatia bacterium]|nr:IPT/TIG domain-containing protein [Candidatus Tanganyikabacteria bacterium]
MALCALAGCTLFGPLQGVPPAGGGAGAPTGALATGAQSERGILRIRIVWPRRDLPGFEAQVIPLRTQAIRLITRNGQGEEADRRILARTIGPAEVSASIFLAPGDGYSVAAAAFGEQNPSDGATPIAQGTAANLPIRAGKTVQVPITLTAAYAPAITGLAPGTGPFGTEVAISGISFGASLGLDFYVTFAGVLAASTRSSDTAAVALVPPGPSGNVVVVVDGVPSTSVAPFAVTDGFLTSLLESIDLFERTGLLAEVRAAPTPAPNPTPAPGTLGTDMSSPANPTPTPVATGGMEVNLE